MSDESNQNSLRFRSLSVHRMPGFESSTLHLDNIGTGITVVHGPNAAGKTTLVRAFNLLLWPQRSEFEHARVSGEFDLRGDGWYVEYDAGSRRFQREGEPTEPPSLPPPERADRYNLALHDLLQEDTRNRSFANFIVRELSGGYDLNKAAEELGFTDRPSGRGKTTRTAENRIKKIRDLRRKIPDRREVRQKLSDLQRQRDQAVEARSELQYWKQLLTWYDAREEHRERRAELQHYPGELEKYTGDELDRLETIQDELSHYREQERSGRETILNLEEKRDELNYPYEEEVNDKVRELESKQEKLKEQESRIEQLEAERREAEARRHNEAESLGSQISKPELREFDRIALDELTELARKEETTRNRLETFERYRELLIGEEDAPREDPDDLRRGSEVLENWLANAKSTNFPQQNMMDVPQVVSSALIATLAVVSGVYIHPYFYGFLIAPVVLHGWVRWRTYQESVKPNGDNPARQAARQEYKRLDIKSEPNAWTPDDVRKELENLYDRWGQSRLYEREQSEWNRFKEEHREVESRRETLEKRIMDFEEKYGLSPGDARTLQYLLERLSRWKDADNKILGLQKKIESLRTNCKELLEKVNDEFTKWSLKLADDASEFSARIRQVRDRIEEFHQIRRSLKQAREQLEEAEQKIPELENRRDKIYEKVSLEPGDKDGLRDLSDRYEAYRKQVRTCQQKETVRNREYDRLVDYDQYEQIHESWEREEIERKLEESKSESERYEDLIEEIADLKARIDEEKKSYDLEPALADRERALENLREQLYEDCEAMIGDVVRQHVESIRMDEARPAAYEKAQERLATITSGRYRLRLNPSTENPLFRVVDSRTGEGKGLDELSGGTRVQVLLAVRMGFVETVENRTQLPIYLDETLANADDEKARTIIESMVELAQTGRQVFYFTAQGDEVAKWRAYADDPRLVDLKEKTNESLNGLVDVPDRDELSVSVSEVPPPEGNTHEQYGEKIDLPPFDPHRPVESVHIWYLVEDVNLLEELLSMDLQRWGSLETLMNISGRSWVSAQESDLSIARQRAGATETFINRWRIGRNRRIDRSVLVETDSVSTNFIDEVDQLAEQCDYEPAKLLEALRDGAVSGFRTQKMDELGEFLRRTDYIDDRNPIALSVIRAAMITNFDDDLVDSPEAQIDRLLNRLLDSKRS